MLSKEYISKSSVSEDRHLYLVDTSNRRRGLTHKSAVQPDMATVRQLTHAIMNRLEIPYSTSIVGLLNVGISRSNYHELSKWIFFNVTTLPTGCIADELTELARRFFREVDHFPYV